MTPLSDALTTAQRRALAALEKAYVAGQVDAEAFTACLEACGISDPIDVAFLLSALDVLREWGVQAPTMAERVTDEKMSDKQRDYILQLASEKGYKVSPDDLTALSKQGASQLIERLRSGKDIPEGTFVPF